MSEAQNKAFKKWFEKNKDKLSETRRRRYKEDPAYRAKCVEEAAEWKKNNPPPSRAGESRLKMVNGSLVELFRIGDVSQMIGICIQSIRGWEASEIIPKPIVERAQRYYNQNQIALMRELADLCHQHRYDRVNRASVVASKSAEVWKKWDRKDGG